MINILIPGKSYEVEDIFFIEECPRCHCQFEFQKADCCNITRPFPSEEFGYYVFCPECTYKIAGTTINRQRRVVKRLVSPQR